MEYMFMPLRRYADFSGRSRRMEFWMWQLFQFIVYIGIVVLMMVFGGGAMMMGDPNALVAAGGVIFLVFALYGIYALAVLIPSLAVAVRRLHDTERSGWWILAPLAGYLLAIIGGVMAASSPDSAGVGGIIALVGFVVMFGLGLTLLVFYFLEGTRGPNKYGPDPKQPTPDKVFA